MNIGKRLEIFIVTNFNEKQEFAKLIEVSPSMLSQWTTEQRVPSGETLRKIAELGCNINWLLTGKGRMRLQDNLPDEKLDLIISKLDYLIIFLNILFPECRFR